MSVCPSPLTTSGGQGNSLAENLERQIRRRHSQLSTLEHRAASIEVSVIRHTSTPHEHSFEAVDTIGENISEIQALVQVENPDPVLQAPFLIYLDNPDQFYSRHRLVSTESSSFFSEMAGNDDERHGLGGPGVVVVGVHQVPDEHEFRVEGVKAELNTKLFELHTLKDVYNPSTYDPDVLIANRAEWTAEVKTAYMDVMKCVSSNLTKPEASQEDKTVLKSALAAAQDEFKGFLSDFTKKCSVDGGAAVPAPRVGVQQPPVSTTNKRTVQLKSRVSI